MSMHVETLGEPRELLSRYICLSFKIMSFLGLVWGRTVVVQAGWLGTPRDPPISFSPALTGYKHSTAPGF